jgi:hypothetical protein
MKISNDLTFVYLACAQSDHGNLRNEMGVKKIAGANIMQDGAETEWVTHIASSSHRRQTKRSTHQFVSIRKCPKTLCPLAVLIQ